MSNLVFNENTYFTKNIFLNKIDILNQPILNINNMSVTGNISINNVNVPALNTAAIATNNSTLINISPTYNNTTKIQNSIGYFNTASNTTTVNYTALTSKQQQISISSIPAGVYIIDYSYNITTLTNTGMIMNVYEYLDNFANNVTTNIIQKGKSIVYDSVGASGNQNETTFGVLTEATNTIIFSLQCTNYNSGLTVQFKNFFLRYTRLA